MGTTNRTRLADYREAIGPATGLLAKIHRSNFGLVGFTEEVSVAELARLAQAHELPLFADMGSGALKELPEAGSSGAQTVASLVLAGADLVAFSGDKLLGGPQAGVLVGRKALIAKLKAHPLNRALRIDKLTVAALEATLEIYRDGLEDAEIPTRALLVCPPERIARKALDVSRIFTSAGVGHRVVASEGRVGGGSLPMVVLDSRSVVIEGAPGAELAAQLRNGSPPVVARVLEDHLWLDLRCIDDADIPVLVKCITAALDRLRSRGGPNRVYEVRGGSGS